MGIDTDLTLTGRLLEGRQVVITGAASEGGIGQATAKLFVEHGARPAILDMDQAASEAMAERVGGGAIGIQCDITKKIDCDNAVARTLKEFGRIDILINNAGITHSTRIMDATPEDFDLLQAVNVRGGFFMSQAVIPHMRERGSGNIVFLSSVAGQRGGGLYGSTHYAASKAAVLGMAKALGRELAEEGIRVNAVAPSLIKTDVSAMTKFYPPNAFSTQGTKVVDSAEKRGGFEQGVPMKRSGNIWEVAGAILFLASDLSSYMTGTNVDVNGGFHIY